MLKLALLLLFCLGSSWTNGKRIVSNVGRMDIEIPTIQELTSADGWKFFRFGKPFIPSDHHFVLNLERPSFLAVTDLYCKGDQFKVFNWNFLLMTTGKVNATCEENSYDPVGTYYGEGWSIGVTLMDVGRHVISIIPIESPFDMGEAAIRLFEQDDIDVLT